MLPARLTYYPPAAPARPAAVVICPGGGYRFLSDREAAPIARAFNRLGYHAYVAEYEVNRPGLGFTPVRQLAAAVQQVSAQAVQYGFDTDKIFLCGFSAGGHLAATLGVYWNDPAVTALPAEQAVRPAGMILAYPVITMGEYAHPGSREMLTAGDAALCAALSLERQVTAQAAPAFVWQTITDEKVPVQNSLLLVQALLAAGVPVECHLYDHGKHGMSLATEEVAVPEEDQLPDPHIATWLQQCDYWLQERIGGTAL